MRLQSLGALGVLAGLGLAGFGLAGCSSGSSTNSASGGSSGPIFNGLSPLFSASAREGLNASAAVPAGTPTVECPAVDIRQDAGTWQVTGKPSEEGAMNIRYQVSIGQTARECRLVGQNVTMRVGVQGRIVLGPAGDAGTLDVPVRFAVIKEGPEPKTIATKLQRVPVTIPGANTNVAFTTVEEDLSFPLPPGGDIDKYMVYVGFDPQGFQPNRPAPRPQRARRNPA